MIFKRHTITPCLIIAFSIFFTNFGANKIRAESPFLAEEYYNGTDVEYCETISGPFINQVNGHCQMEQICFGNLVVVTVSHEFCHVDINIPETLPYMPPGNIQMYHDSKNNIGSIHLTSQLAYDCILTGACTISDGTVEISCGISQSSVGSLTCSATFIKTGITFNFVLTIDGEVIINYDSCLNYMDITKPTLPPVPLPHIDIATGANVDPHFPEHRDEASIGIIGLGFSW